MTYGTKRKAVEFNLDNQQERAMYELAQRTNFGRLVKRYLAAELQRQERTAQQSTIQYRPVQG